MTAKVVQWMIPATLRAVNLAWLGDVRADVSVLFVSAEEGRKLNQEYRHKDYATNILSFPSDDVDFMPYRFLLIGDLVICPEVVQREAREQNKSEAAHLAHLLVHGMLHLQGYDHEDDQSAEAMEALEVRILAQAGFSNPYALS